VLQKGAYSFVIFVAAPLMVATGLTMSPAVTAAFPVLLDLFGGIQSARTIHFFTSAVLVLFVIVHVVTVVRSGFRRQIRAMTWGDDMKGRRRPPVSSRGRGPLSRGRRRSEE
jgi:thiosulfate reductase cytochrome b subunit